MMNQPDSLKHRTILNFARAFFNYNPRIVTLCVALLVLSGLMEAIGIVMLLPLISMTLTQNTDNPDFLTRAITQTFDRFGISFELHTALIVISTVILLKAIFIYLAQRVNAKLAVDFSKDMRLRLMNTVISSQWGHFVMRSTGRFANAITQQCTSIVNICNGVLNLYSMIFLSIIYLSIAVLSSVKVFLFSAAVGVFMFFVLKNIIRLTKIINARFVVNSEKLSDQLINSLNIFKPLKAMGQQNRITPFMHKEIDGMRDTTFKITLLSNFTTLVQEPIVVIFLSIGIFLIATVSSVEASFLIFSAVLYYRIVGKIGEIQARVQKLSGAQNNYWSVLELIEEGEKYQETSKTTTERLKLRKGLKLENLDFSYGKKAVLHNINLDLPLAGLITIMGPSGSGKTTLTDLICGLYTPSAGRILIDDTDIQDIDMIAWRHALGLVPQDTVLTNDTIYNNVTLFDHTIPKSTVEKTLKELHAWDFVSEKPEGLDFIVGENGIRLSGGQRQRIAIARALIRNPDLLILDEPTSALDTKTANKICRLLADIAKKCTVLVITHQSDIVALSDDAYQMHEGTLKPFQNACNSKEAGHETHAA